MRVLVELRGPSKWSHGDSDLVLESGTRHDLTLEGFQLQALRDACDAKVGIFILAEGDKACNELLRQESDATSIEPNKGEEDEEDQEGEEIKEVTDGSSS